MKEINNECTNEIVCPYCGNEFSDSFEYGDEEDIGLIKCEECEKEFYATRNISISYSTEKATYGTCKCCKRDNIVIENYNSSIGTYEDLCLQCGENEQLRLQKQYLKSL